MGHFDSLASTWDENPSHTERAKVFSEEIMKSIKLSKEWTALEYGCGTGILSFLLHSHLNSIVLADDSIEMLKVAEKKIKANNISNMKTIRLNLMTDDYKVNHDLVYSAMALHHVENTDLIIEKFYKIINENGYLCIADLVQETGSFHAHLKDFHGHNGFNTSQLEQILIQKGFKEVSSKIVYTMERENEIKKYPLFLMIGKK
jgi:ubiquinone/menaquinone biosynthesis C-methylase UbiE